MTHYPKKLWNGISTRRVPNQYSDPLPEDWDEMVSEMMATQKAMGIKSDWPQRDLRTLAQAVKAELRSNFQRGEFEATSARRAGLSARQIVTKIAMVNTHPGAADFSIWVPPPHKCVITEISAVFKTAPSSAAGTVVLDLYKYDGAADTLIQKTAGYDLEGLTAKTPAKIPLAAKAVCTIQPGDYIYGTVTTDNADAVDGVNGLLVLTYIVCK